MKALGVAALAAAALLLAPGEARAQALLCGNSNDVRLDCPNRDYPDGIVYGLAGDSSNISHGVPQTLNLLGHSSGPITLTAGARGIAFGAQASGGSGLTLNIGGATGGTAHVVRFVQGTNSVSGIDRNNGIYILRTANNTGSSTTLNVRAGVTIGTMATPMKQHGIFLRPHADRPSAGRGNAGLTLTTAATIHAAGQGIRIVRQTGGTNDATTVTNTGALHSGVGNAAATGSYFDRPHGIYVLHGGTQFTGSLTVDNDGDITVGGAYTGILLRYWGAGALSLDNSGDIGAATGQTAKQGIQFNFSYWDNQSAQAVTLTNSGAITASEFGIRLKKLSGGDVELTNRGAVTVTGDAAQHVGHAIYLAEGVTFGEGRTYAANKGDVTIDNSGALSSKNHALYVYRPTTTTGNVADDFELTNSGAITSEEGDGIRIQRPDGTGDVTIDNSGAITAGVNAIWIDEVLTPAATGTVSVTHSAGALSAGRSGIVVQVASSNTAATVTPRSSSAPQPLIDVAWGGTASTGATARGTTGTAASDDGRFAAPLPLDNLLPLDQEAAAVKAVEGTLHYGGPAGIEAYAISWRDVVAQVAKGDDPGAFANAAAQLTAVPTGATAADNAYVAQFRAALENPDLELATLVYNAVKSGASSLSDLSDADIVTFLRVNNGGRRTLLRNVLALGLSDDEKAILRAVATNDGVDAALTAAGFTDDTSDDGDYWSLVKGLLDRYNVGDIRVNVRSGSLAASRGDGIRAYYATPNDDNGAIEVTIAAGASVSGAKAGVYVANAGGDVTVESGGTIRGGTDGIRVIKPGSSGDLTITTTGGSITATSGAGIHPQDNAGHTGTVTVTNAGDVTGGTWGILANRLGAGTVSVASSGGTVWGMTEPGIFAANKAGDASDLSVEVTGGAVRSSGRNKAALHAHNRGTGDLSVTGAGAISKHGAGVFADLGSAYSTTSQVDVTQGGPIQGRTGVYVRVAHGATAATPTARAAGAQPLIDVTWTGSFSHGTAPAVAPNDDGRFAASSVAEALSFDQEAAAVKALEGSLRYGGAAGIEAHALSWRDVVAQVAKGDDPGDFADASAQQTAVPATATASDNDYVKQFKAALVNADLTVAGAVLTAIGSTATTAAGVTDAEIRTYLRTDSDATRALLRNVLAQGLSDKEKAVLRAVAMNDGLATALADADAAFSTAYKNAVNALLNLYNVGDIRVAMNGGSIAAARGDGIRAYYATPNANNGDISVTVGAGASVTGGKAGVYAANAGAIEVTVAAGASVTGGAAGIYVANVSDGLTLARKYTYGFAMGQGATADQAIAVADSGGASLRDQVVTVAGTVTGGTDAGVRLSGGAVIVMRGGSVRAGSSGVGVLADGAALVYVDGEVRGGAGGAAAIHLSGGGDVTVGLNGRVRANGATNAIQSDGSGTDRLTLVTDTVIPYRDDLIAQVEGSLSGIDSARLIEHLNGVPTGYSLTLGITSDGMLDTSKFPSKPISYGCAANERCTRAGAGTIANRRTGVYAAVPRAGARGATQPLIDVNWRATFSQGTAGDAGRFAAATARDALVFDRESEAVKAAAATIRWGAPAGIEAHALSWRELAEEVAKGDDPGAIANAAAQTTLLATSGAGSRRAAILAQFRAALGNADLAVAASVLAAIDTDGTTGLSDAEIVTYLSADDAPTRALLRNVLAQGLSEKEKAVLAAVAADDAGALTAALDDTDAAFSNAYKTAVRALLGRRNAGDIRVRMASGSIVTQGDGIRAYYATPNADNGGISVTIGAGARVTADLAGVYVANAGGSVMVANEGIITADAHGIRVADAGGAVTVSNSGTITAGASGASDTYGIYVADADGDVTVTSSGTITAGASGASDIYGIHVVKPGASGDVTITTTGGSITATADAGIGIYPQDNADHTGTVTVANGGDVTAEGYGILVARLGSGAVTVTNTGGTVLGRTQPGIFAANKEGDASAVTVRVTGGAVRTEGRNKPAVDARNRGTGDLSVAIAAGATAVSKHAAGVFASLGDAPDNRVRIDQGGTIRGRTGVHALVAHGSTAETVPESRTPPDAISVAWTGTFSHGTTADVAPNDEGRFLAATNAESLDFNRESAAMEAVGGDGSIRWGAPAGIEAQVMSWRNVASVVATGDDPGEIADATAQANLLSETHADSRRAAILAQVRAALRNDDVMVETGSALAMAIDAIDANDDAEYTDEEIAAYLGADDADTRTGLRALLAQSLSDGEKAILAAVAAGDDAGLTAALTAAGFTDDGDYWSRVKALLDRYNVGGIRVAMTGGSIDSRGDGIRAYYATPHANNGGIRVTVGAGAEVTGAKAGVHVANAGPGLMLERKYTSGFTENDDPDELVAVTRGEGANAVPLRNQLVTVAGTVTGGTDAAVRLNGGGAVIVMAGGRAHAGSSGVGILADGPAHLFIDGEVKGGAGGAAAVDLPGGGAVIVGRNGRVQADGADHAIRGGDDFETAVTVTVATGPTAYRENVDAQLNGLLKGVEGGVVRLREYRNDGFTGYRTGELTISADGEFDTSELPPRPCGEDQFRGADGMCADRPTDSGRVAFTGDGGMESHDDGIRAWYAEPGDGNGGISVTVPAGVNVTGSEAGVYVENAGPGLRIRKRYAPEAIRRLAVNEDAGEDDLVAMGSLNAAGNAIETPWLDQLVTVEGTVTGGTDAAVHLNGGGAVIVMAGGRVIAGSSGVAVRVNDPGPAHLFIDGEVRGGVGGAAAVDLPAGGSVVVGPNGRVQANGARNVIRGGDTAATEVNVTVDVDRPSPSPDDVNARVEGSLEGVEGGVVRLRELDPNGVPIGYSRTLPIKDGMLDTSGLDDPEEGDDVMALSCEEVERIGDRRCRLYEALPSMLLAMNALPSWADRMAAARDGNGVWARVEAAQGKWRAKQATTTGELAYDHNRGVGQAGFEFAAGENGRGGVSAHAVGGKASMSGVGEVDLKGWGAGISATWLDGAFYVDAQAAATAYDVDVKSYTHGRMSTKSVHGAGYAVGVDVGVRAPVGEAFLTPRAGVAWSRVDLAEFRDLETAGDGDMRARVSVADANSVKGRVGMTLEAAAGTGRLFGSLDVEREFTGDTKTTVGRAALRTEARPTAARLGLGGVFDVDENVRLKATAGYRTSGNSATSGYDGGLELQVRF